MRPPSSGRIGKQVQHHQHHIDLIPPAPSPCSPSLASARRATFATKRPRERHHEIRRRPGRRHPDHVALRVAQVAEVHRHRLRPAEQEAAAARELRQEQQADRDQHRADRIDVLQRIQRDAAQHPGGLVAEDPGDVAVGGFVQRDREDHRHRLERDGREQRKIHWLSHFTRVRGRRTGSPSAAQRRASPGRLEAEPRRVAAAAAHDDRRHDGEVDDRRRLRRARSGVDDEIERAADGILGSLRRRSAARSRPAGSASTTGSVRPSSASSACTTGCSRHAHADRAALRMLQAPRHLARRRQQEREAARRPLAHDPELPVVEPGEMADLGQVAAARASGDARRRRRGSGGSASPRPRRRGGSRARSSSRSDRR